MADRMTGLGQTIDAHEDANGTLLLSDAHRKVADAMDGCISVVCGMGDVSIGEDCSLCCMGEHVAMLDSAGYSMICKALGMPVPYILRLPKSLKRANIAYWLGMNEEKDVSVKAKDGELVEFRCDTEVELADVLGIADSALPCAKVFRTLPQTNSVLFDVYDDGMAFDTEHDTYLGGLRIVCRKGLRAPEVSPILLNANSCGIVDFADFVAPICIKNLSYSDVLRAIEASVSNCVSAIGPMFSRFASVCGEEIPNAHRRIALYCRESGLPDRVRSYALSEYDENSFAGDSRELIAGMFSVLGYADSIKESSSRKAQRLAGRIAAGERDTVRCGSCDSIVITD